MHSQLHWKAGRKLELIKDVSGVQDLRDGKILTYFLKKALEEAITRTLRHVMFEFSFFRLLHDDFLYFYFY